ncbi:transposase [Streptomyces sp. NPDC004735]|uniref:transposase n=1 Tax=Streptomyces sp. NPDC004735 TaxID=3156654 RepID=UPI0033BD0B82
MRGREVADPGSGPVPAGPADDARGSRAPQPRLHPRRHHHSLRRLGSRDGQGDRIAPPPPPRAVEFKKFLAKLDREVPVGLQVQLILDNYATHKTPAVKKWLLAHPRFHLHFTPTSASWLNLVERWFAGLTQEETQARSTPLRPSPRTRRPGLAGRLERPTQALHLDQVGRRNPRQSRRLLPPESLTQVTRACCGSALLGS